MKLYEMTGRYKELLDSITACTDDGEQFVSLTEELDSIEGDIRTKIENCAKMVRTLDAASKAYKTEEALFEAKKKAANSAAERLEDYIKFCMDTAGLNECKGEKLTVRLCKNGQPSLQIDGKIPEQYQIQQEPKADNKAIKEELLAGKHLDFASLVYGNHIRIN